MSYEVDVIGHGVTMPGTRPAVGFNISWSGEIDAFQWYRISLALDPPGGPHGPGDPPLYTNPPGTLLTIQSEGYGIQQNGLQEQQYARFLIVNQSTFQRIPPAQVTVSFTVNIISTPSHF